MTVERAREFLEAVAADPALRARLESAKIEGTGEAARGAMRAAGYDDVTAEDLKAVLGAGAEGELSDAQLEGVAGGGVIEYVARTVAWIGAKLGVP